MQTGSIHGADADSATKIPAIFDGRPTAPGGELNANNDGARQTVGGPAGQVATER